MSLNKLFSKSTFLLLLAAFLVGCDTGANVTTGTDATGQSEVEGAVEDEAVLETDDTAEDEVVGTDDASGQSEVEGAVEDEAVLETDDTAEDEVAQTTENVTTEEVAENTEELIGQTVTIRSNALEVVEPSVFTVADNEFFDGEEILIVNASGEVFELPEDDTEVQVTGEVTQFVVADIESNYDLDLDPDLYTEYEDRPAIIAQSLAIAPEPGEITEDPTQYYGQTLAVTGEVEQMYGMNTFTLDEEELFGGNDLLVVVPNAEEMVEEGETVAVTGELRSFTLVDLERDYDLTWDLDVQEEIEAEYTEKPVLVVDSIYDSAIPGYAK